MLHRFEDGGEFQQPPAACRARLRDEFARGGDGRWPRTMSGCHWSDVVGKLQIGIIGAGAFGQRHIETISREPLCEVTAIADPTAQAKTFAAQRSFAYYADFDDMLANATLDAVIIATPNAMHAPAGLACAARGLHMLIEKPIAEAVDAATELSDAAQRAGVALLVGHHRRYNPVIAKAREIVQGGRIGRLVAVTALWMIQKPDNYYDVGWRTEPAGRRSDPHQPRARHRRPAFHLRRDRERAGDDRQCRPRIRCRGHGRHHASLCGWRARHRELSDAVAAPWSWELTSGEAPNYPQRPENCYLFAGTAGSLAVPEARTVELRRRNRLDGATFLRAPAGGARGSSGPAASPFLPGDPRRGGAVDHRTRCHADAGRDAGRPQGGGDGGAHRSRLMAAGDIPADPVELRA